MSSANFIKEHILKNREMFFKENFWKGLITVCALLIIMLTLAIGAFLIAKGSMTFIKFDHSIFDFLTSSNWSPVDDYKGGGSVGALIFIWGSLSTCGLALLIATPFSLAAAIFMTEISERLGKSLIQPAVEIFVGIPSVVYGWVGLSVLVPFIRDIFDLQVGLSQLTAGIVLAIMIFPTITTVTADAIRSVDSNVKKAGYALGSTRNEVIWKITLPACKDSIFTAIILGLARAFGEALAVAMVIGRAKQFPDSILDVTTTITTAIASDIGASIDGGELNSALWSLALLLFFIAIIFIFIINQLGKKKDTDKSETKKMKKKSLFSLGKSVNINSQSRDVELETKGGKN